jgi:hypothetical protein
MEWFEAWGDTIVTLSVGFAVGFLMCLATRKATRRQRECTDSRGAVILGATNAPVSNPPVPKNHTRPPMRRPSKELQAWMRKYCRRRERCFGETRCMDLPDLPECPPEGRPDCPALREMPPMIPVVDRGRARPKDYGDFDEAPTREEE